MQASKLIRQILETDERARNDDNYLTARVWLEQSGWLSITLGLSVDNLVEILNVVTDQETIKRTRRHLHQFSYIEYKPEVKEKRYKEFKRHKTKYITAPDDFIGGNYE